MPPLGWPRLDSGHSLRAGCPVFLSRHQGVRVTTIFLATLAPGIARARSSGGDWTVEVVLPEVDVRCLAADPVQPMRVWAGTQGQGMLVSDNAGDTWASAGLDGRIVKAITAT